MKKELVEGNRDMFSRPLRTEMTRALDAREQIILFINRRGFSTSVHCRHCGNVVRCRRCEVSLVYHGARGRLLCHHCGYSINRPRMCRECGSSDLGYIGAGTQRIEQEMRSRFRGPDLPLGQDTASDPAEHEEVLRKLQSGEIDILVGTQMVAQGLHLPQVTLVGVMSADVGINFPDYRAGERIFQVLTQVAGRAGRGQAVGVSSSRHSTRSITPSVRSPPTTMSASPARRFSTDSRTVTHPSRGSPGLPIPRSTPERPRLRLSMSPRPSEMSVTGSAYPRLKCSARPVLHPRLKGRYRWQILTRGSEPGRLLQKPAPETAGP